MSGPRLPEPPEGRLGETMQEKADRLYAEGVDVFDGMVLLRPIPGGPCESVGCGGTFVTPTALRQKMVEEIIEIANEPCPSCGCPGKDFDGHVCEDYDTNIEEETWSTTTPTGGCERSSGTGGTAWNRRQG